MKDTITMNEIRATSTWSVKDDSPRGCKTVSNSEVKPGDKVIYNNRFTLVIDEPETEEEETTKRTAEEVTADINSICIDCVKFRRSCEGTTCQVWTGCVHRETEREQAARVFEHYKRRLIRISSGNTPNTLRFAVIEYLCYFPQINPVKMAVSLRREGIQLIFDDSSISKQENAAKEAAVNKAMRGKEGRRNEKI